MKRRTFFKTALSAAGRNNFVQHTLYEVIRASFTLAGGGSGVAYNMEEFKDLAKAGIEASPINEIEIMESMLGCVITSYSIHYTKLYDTGYKNVTIGEPVFQGHFPGHPIYPGVMIIEGMAQAGGVLAFESMSDEDKEGTQDKVRNNFVQHTLYEVIRLKMNVSEWIAISLLQMLTSSVCDG